MTPMRCGPVDSRGRTSLNTPSGFVKPGLAASGVPPVSSPTSERHKRPRSPEGSHATDMTLGPGRTMWSPVNLHGAPHNCLRLGLAVSAKVSQRPRAFAPKNQFAAPDSLLLLHAVTFYRVPSTRPHRPCRYGLAHCVKYTCTRFSLVPLRLCGCPQPLPSSLCAPWVEKRVERRLCLSGIDT